MVASDHSNGRHEDSSSSSEASSPVRDPYLPFQPKYSVKVSEPVKNGDTVHYTLKTTRYSDGCDFSVSRKFDDFEFLHHCLLTQNNTDGIIMPPLPPKPTIDAREADQRSKKYPGSASNTLIGDEFHKDCQSLEKYLYLVITHEVLGKSPCLEPFLCQKQAPAGSKIKRGIIGKLLTAADEARKSNHVDIEEYFQKARSSANEFAAAVQQASCATFLEQEAWLFDERLLLKTSDVKNLAFNQMVHTQLRISIACAQLSTALSSCPTNVGDDQGSDADRLFIKFSETIDDAKQGIDAEIYIDESILGFWLDLYARYSVSVKDMLYRRTCLMIDYEESNRMLDKAKPAKKHLAEDSKVAAEKSFENCSEVAQRELVIFDRQRRCTLQETMCVYADAKIKTARDTLALLEKSLTYFKQLESASS